MHHYYNMVKQAFWKVVRGLQLSSVQCWCWFCWIMWTPHNFGFVAWLDAVLLWYVTSDPDHSVIDNKTHREDHLPQNCTNSARWHAFWKNVRGIQFKSVGCWFWFVGLNAPHATLALWLGWMHHYYNTVKQAFWKVVRGVAIIISAVLVLVLLDYVSPVQLCLCCLVRRSTTMVHELRPWSLSHRL